jgi:predicted RNase H-like nuclease (RuvC/YqgF family)
VDEVTEEAERAARRELVERDAEIGAQAQLEAAAAQVAALTDRVETLRARVRRQKDEITRLRERVAELESSSGGLLRSAYRKVRR